MSESRTALDDMSRDELEAHARSLEADLGEMGEEMRQVQTDLAFMKRALTVLTDADLGDEMGVSSLPEHAERTRGDIEDLKTATKHHGDQLEAVANVGNEKTDKDQKVAAIAAFAIQKGDAPDAKVLVDAGEIRGCIGCSRRYAYDLIDSLGADDGIEWAAKRDSKTVRTGTGTRQKKKALKVDCDSLRESSHAPDGVNKFTTRTTEEDR